MIHNKLNLDSLGRLLEFVQSHVHCTYPARNTWYEVSIYNKLDLNMKYIWVRQAITKYVFS